MGFAVVADEVRSLAQRSAQAAKETAARIEDAVTRNAEGVGISTRVADALSAINDKVRQVDELVAEVAGASREQTEGISQISTAVSQMDKVTQGTAAHAEESAAAATELNAQADAMQHSVRELLLLIGGRSNANATPTNPPSGARPSAKHSPPPAVPTKPSPKSESLVAFEQSLSRNGHGHPVTADRDFRDF